MNIKIKINKLGPIIDSEIDLNKSVILTGPSSVGKSYTAFALYYVYFLFSDSSYKNKEVFNRLNLFIEDKVDNDLMIDREKKTVFKSSISELSQWMKKDFQDFVRYLLNFEDFKCDVEFLFDDCDEDLNIVAYREDVHEPGINIVDPIKVFINNDLSSVKVYYVNEDIIKLSNITNFFIIDYFQDHLFKKSSLESFLLPPARGGFINTSLSLAGSVTEGMYDIFIRNLESTKGVNPVPVKDKSFYEEISQTLFGGEIVESRGSVMLKLDSDEQIPITAAASSIKELSPLLMLIKKYGDNLKDFSILFEEPEAHLHPTKQQDVANVLVKCINKGMNFIITTHSDYLLSRINALIRLHKIKSLITKDRYNALCTKIGLPNDLSLDSNLLDAYYFELQDDNKSVRIKKLKTSDGISFSTFSKAVDEQINIEDEIYDILEEVGRD